jgi:putative transposase
MSLKVINYFNGGLCRRRSLRKKAFGCVAKNTQHLKSRNPSKINRYIFKEKIMDFKWCHFQSDIILLCTRWYLSYPLSYRNIEDMMLERGVEVDHSTINRWVLRFTPEIEKKFRKHKGPTGTSWRMDETYIKIKGQWKYLYRAVDKEGRTIDFLLTAKRDRKAAKRFFNKAIKSSGVPEKINIDKADISQVGA